MGESQEVPKSGENKKVVKIGTESFPTYLVGITETDEGLLRGDLDDFEKQIEIPQEIHKVIKEMYEQEKRGSTIGPIEKKRREGLIKGVNEIHSGLGETLREQQPKADYIEQVRAIYLNIKNYEIGSTTSFYGHGSEVAINEPLEEAVANDGFPIMMIHTHPAEANLSFNDYLPFLMAEPTGSRLVKAQIVLLPEMQLMAVVTKDTPVFTNIDELDSFLSTRANEVSQKELQMAKRFIEKLEILFDKKLFIDVINNIKKERFGEKHIEKDEVEKIEREIEDETKRAPDEIARMVNRALIAFGREMNVKFYSSQDMKNFKEFSA